jgi:HAMP domain-containing protein
MTGPHPGRPSLLPALFAVALIAALGAFLWLRRGEPRGVTAAAAPAVAAGEVAEPPAAPSSQPAPTAPPARVAAAASASATRLVPEDEPQLSDEEPPEAKSKKPKLTLDEKLALTQTHVEVMKTRAELLQRDIDALDAAGRKEEAAQKQILLTRLRAHMDRLRQAVAERREPE